MYNGKEILEAVKKAFDEVSFPYRIFSDEDQDELLTVSYADPYYLLHIVCRDGIISMKSPLLEEAVPPDMLPRAWEVLNYVNFWNRETKFFLDSENYVQAEYDVLPDWEGGEDYIRRLIRDMYSLFIPALENAGYMFVSALYDDEELTLPRGPEWVSTEAEAQQAYGEIRTFWKENMDPCLEDWGMEDVDCCLQISKEEKEERLAAGEA